MQHSNNYYYYIRSPQWRKKSNFCLALTRKRCVIFPWLKASHAHHMHYKNMENELPIRDTIPLSKFAHMNIIHGDIWGWYPFWKKSPLRPILAWYMRVAFLLSIMFWWTIGLLIK